MVEKLVLTLLNENGTVSLNDIGRVVRVNGRCYLGSGDFDSDIFISAAGKALETYIENNNLKKFPARIEIVYDWNI